MFSNTNSHRQFFDFYFIHNFFNLENEDKTSSLYEYSHTNTYSQEIHMCCDSILELNLFLFFMFHYFTQLNFKQVVKEIQNKNIHKKTI